MFKIIFIFAILTIIVAVILVILFIISSLRKRATESTYTDTDHIDKEPPISSEGIVCPRCGAGLKVENLHKRSGNWYGHCPYCDSDFGLEE